jgi:hypothetical protein
VDPGRFFFGGGLTNTDGPNRAPQAGNLWGGENFINLDL